MVELTEISPGSMHTLSTNPGEIHHSATVWLGSAGQITTGAPVQTPLFDVYQRKHNLLP